MTMDKYELIRSNRKTIALQIKGDGRIIVRAPLRMAAKDIQRFVDSKAAWIEKHLAIIRQRQQPAASAFTLEQLQQLADSANRIVRNVLSALPRLSASPMAASPSGHRRAVGDHAPGKAT